MNNTIEGGNYEHLYNAEKKKPHSNVRLEVDMILILIALLAADEFILRLTNKCEKEIEKIEGYFSLVILADKFSKLNEERSKK